MGVHPPQNGGTGYDPITKGSPHRTWETAESLSGAAETVKVTCGNCASADTSRSRPRPKSAPGRLEENKADSPTKSQADFPTKQKPSGFPTEGLICGNKQILACVWQLTLQGPSVRKKETRAQAGLLLRTERLEWRLLFWCKIGT